MLEKKDKKVKPALVSLKKAKVAVKAAIKRVSHAITEGQKKRSKAAIKKAVKKVEVKKAAPAKIPNKAEIKKLTDKADNLLTKKTKKPVAKLSGKK